MNAPAPPPFARLLLALGATGGRAAVEFSAHLAGLLRIPMDTLFIEDEELLSVAALPVAREISRLGVMMPGLDLGRMERELRRQATRLEQLARRCQASGGLESRFRVVRGQTAVELRGALRPGDCLVLSRELGPMTGPGGVGSAVQSVLTAAWSALLLMDENLPLPASPVTTWYDGSPASEVALLLAQRLAQARGQRLHVMLPAAGATGRELHLRAQRHAAGAVCSVLAPAADTLAAIASLRGGLLVLPAPPLGLTGARLEQLLRLVRTPLLLLRMAGEHHVDLAAPLAGRS